MTLRELGHEVRITDRPRSALELIHASMPDFVLTDLFMPDTSGVDIARQLRSDPATQRIRLIAVTGYSDELTRERTLEAGFDGYLLKPVDPAALQALLVSDA